MEKHDTSHEDYVQPNPEARQALAKVGIETVAEQDAYYRRLTKAVRDAEKSRALQDAIETAASETDSDTASIVDDTLIVSHLSPDEVSGLWPKS